MSCSTVWRTSPNFCPLSQRRPACRSIPLQSSSQFTSWLKVSRKPKKKSGKVAAIKPFLKSVFPSAFFSYTVCAFYFVFTGNLLPPFPDLSLCALMPTHRESRCWTTHSSWRTWLTTSAVCLQYYVELKPNLPYIMQALRRKNQDFQNKSLESSLLKVKTTEWAGQNVWFEGFIKDFEKSTL